MHAALLSAIACASIEGSAFSIAFQGVDETSSQRPILSPLEAGDHSVHGGTGQNNTHALYAHLAQQQSLAAAGVQPEHGGAVRGSHAAAAALQLAQVRAFGC